MAGFHRRIPVDHPSRVGEARRIAAELAGERGLDEVAAGRVALIVTELGGNLSRHAQGGELWLAPLEGGVEIIAVDRGPGIADVDRCLADGYSTGSTPGTGLGAVRRLADEFDIYARVPDGTIVWARVGAAAAPGRSFDWAGIALPAPGEQVCGDGWAVHEQEGEAAVCLADGLGHGPDAAAASAAAVAAFRRDPLAGPARLLAQAHPALRSTRGAALSLYHLDAGAGTVRSAGAGNILGRLVSGTSDKAIMGQHGTAGVQIRTPEEVAVPWPAHAALVIHSDGVASRWDPALLAPVLRHHPAIAAALLLRNHRRGRDDATVLVVRRSE